MLRLVICTNKAHKKYVKITMKSLRTSRFFTALSLLLCMVWKPYYCN